MERMTRAAFSNMVMGAMIETAVQEQNLREASAALDRLGAKVQSMLDEGVVLEGYSIYHEDGVAMGYARENAQYPERFTVRGDCRAAYVNYMGWMAFAKEIGCEYLIPEKHEVAGIYTERMVQPEGTGYGWNSACQQIDQFDAMKKMYWRLGK
jgi:hypothetical protein